MNPCTVISRELLRKELDIMLEAVEIIVTDHGDWLKERDPDDDPGTIQHVAELMGKYVRRKMLLEHLSASFNRGGCDDLLYFP